MKKLTTLLAICFCLCLGSKLCAEPVNDNCSTATTLTVSPDPSCANSISGSTAEATPSDYGAWCFGYADDDVWYKFTATATKQLVTFSNVSADLDKSIWSGDCSGLSFRNCFDAATNQFLLSNLLIGQTYFIQVYSDGYGNSSSFDICVSKTGTPPPNDNCAGAVLLTPAAGTDCTTWTAGSTVGANGSIYNNQCGGTDADDEVWFKFVATAATHFVNLDDATNDCKFDIWSGACNNLTLLNCYGYPPQLTLQNLIIGQTYFVRVYSIFNYEYVNFNLCITSPPPPPANDNCSGATVLTVNSDLDCGATTAGTTTGGTPSGYGTPCYSGTDDEVWYSFTATGISHQVSFSNISLSLGKELWTGNCNNLNLLQCLPYWQNDHLLTSLNPGQTYFLRVYSENSNQPADFTLCVGTPPPPPANDNCSGATVLTVNSDLACTSVTTGTTTGGTPSFYQNYCGGDKDDEVWYSFTATGASHVVSFANASTYLTMQVFQGDCNNLAFINCTTGNPSGSLTLQNLTAGLTYFVRIYTYEAGVYGSFDLCVGTPPPPPANDNCDSATPLTVNSTLDCTATTAGNTFGATPSAFGNGCWGNADDEVWFSFVATGSAHQVQVLNPSTPINYELWSGDCFDAANLGCFASWGSNQMIYNLTAGATYFVRVYTYYYGETGSFDVCVGTPPPPPANDNCSGAIALTVNPDDACGTTTAGTTIGGTPSQNLSSCFSGPEDDVWYSFVATNAVHLFNFSNATTPIFKEIWENDCGTGSFSLFSCLPNTPNYIVGGLTVGNTYLLRVYSETEQEYADFDICIGTPPPPPANDECSGAIALTANPDFNCATTTAGSTAGATQSSFGYCFSGTDDDVWFSFVATNSVHKLEFETSSEYLMKEIWYGDCSNLNFHACYDGYNNEFFLQNLSVGTTYFVRLYSYDFIGYEDFDICLGTLPPPPANDDCAAATVLTVNPTLDCTTTTAGTTLGSTYSGSYVCFGTSHDVWFSFVATAPLHHIEYSGAPNGLFLEIFQNGWCDGNGGFVTCTTSPNFDLPGLTVGETYFIKIGSYDLLQQTDFDLCVSTPIPPANDLCANAQNLAVSPDLTCSTSFSGTTQYATPSSGIPTLCFWEGYADDDVWMKFTATAATHFVELSSDNSVLLEIYTGDCGGFVVQECVSSSSNFPLTNLTVGEEYFIRLFTYGGAANYTICVTTPPVPANDDCANATILTVNLDLNCTTTASATTLGASVSGGQQCGDSGCNDVWFSFVATGATHQLVFEGIQNYLAKEVYSGDCSNLSMIYCDASQNFYLFNLTAGETYFVRTSTCGNYFENFTVCVGTPPPPPANDECSGAFDLPINLDLNCGNVASGTTSWATPSDGTLNCSPNDWANDDVWYTFTPTTSSMSLNLTTVSGYAVEGELYVGGCGGSLSFVKCVSSNTSNFLFNLSVGQTHYLRIFNQGNFYAGFSDFTACLSNLPAPPANDECLTATTVSVSPNLDCDTPLTGSIAGATPSNVALNCSGGGLGDAWFSFVATAVQHRISMDLFGGSPISEIWSGDCAANFSFVSCHGQSQYDLYNLTIGETYFLRIFVNGSGDFSLCVGTPPPPPANDNCENAENLTVNLNQNCTATTSGTTAWATPSPQGNACYMYNDDDVWYTFTAAGTAHNLYFQDATNWLIVNVYADGCAAGNLIYCTYGIGNFDFYLSNLMPGQTYTVRVQSYYSGASANFDLCIFTLENDWDGDGVFDALDNCVYNFNTDQADADNDFVGDVCDNCDADANFDQANADGDSFGNACDNCPNQYNEDQLDGDLDEIGDACDNCPADSNADQADNDGDNLGDLCDTDDDNDGFLDVDDGCPFDSNKSVEGICGCGVADVDADGDGVFACQNDCDDNNPQIFPGNTEICDSQDNDCDGETDENLLLTFYFDGDGDGYGDDATAVLNCFNPGGYVEISGDCNDGNSNAHPNATEICDGVDNDCNQQIDENLCCPPTGLFANNLNNTSARLNWDDMPNDPRGYIVQWKKTGLGGWSSAIKSANIHWHDLSNLAAATTYDWRVRTRCEGTSLSEWSDVQQFTTLECPLIFRDFDGDGFGTTDSTMESCVLLEGFSVVAGDCNDQNSNVHPNALETCNGSDENCNGLVDEEVQTTFFEDADGDGFGNLNSTALGCTVLQGFVENDDDCDDSNSQIHPNATEICNATDDNCNGENNEGLAVIWYKDTDGDGYGNPTKTKLDCAQPVGYVADNTDCKDNNAAINPAAPEICNSFDDNCDGTINEGLCTTPDNLAATPASTTADLTWNAAACATNGYQIQYRKIGAAVWKTKNVVAGTLATTLTALLANSNYEWQIRSRCPSGQYSDWSALQFFTTNPPVLRLPITVSRDEEQPATCPDVFENQQVVLFQNQPNPFSEDTRISFCLPEQMEATLTIWDETGRELFRRQAIFEKGESQILLTSEDLPARGWLIYRLETSTGSATQRMLKI